MTRTRAAFAFGFLCVFLGVGAAIFVVDTPQPTDASNSAYLAWTTGQSTSPLYIPSANQYTGGVFRISSQTFSAALTRIVVTLTGLTGNSATPDNFSAVHLHYDVDTTSPYDCASVSFSETDPTLGFATTFDGSSRATYTGSVDVSPTKTICFYAVLDVKSSAVNGSEFHIEIVNPCADLSFTGGASAGAEVHEDPNNPCVPVPMTGFTTLSLPPPSVVTAAALGTQAPSMIIPSTQQYVGGKFRLTPDTGSATITSFTITETGTTPAQSVLSAVHLHYDLDATAPHDCAAETFAESDPVFGLAGNFDFSERATFTGSLAVTPTQVGCLYAVFDVMAQAQNNQTVDIEVANPQNDIVFAAGASASPPTPVALGGTTTLTTPASTVVTVAGVGTQVALLGIPSSHKYMGGAFRMVSDTTSTQVTRVIVTPAGAVAFANISGAHLHYDLDVAVPYDCASSFYSESDSTYGLAADFATGKAVFTGTVTVTSTQAACFYVVLDIGSGAQNGDTLELEIVSPSTEIIVSGGATVAPGTTVILNGTTTLSTTAPQQAEIHDGDLVRCSSCVEPHKTYVVKESGGKKFIRHVLDEHVIGFYGHLSQGWPGNIKDVSSLSGLVLSAWIRLPMTEDPFTWRVYEVNADHSRHWITCADPDHCGPTWIAHGGDPHGIYTVGLEEANHYTTGPNVFLQ